MPTAERQSVDFRDEGAVVMDTVIEENTAAKGLNKLPVAGELAPKKEASEQFEENKQVIESKTDYDKRVARDSKMKDILEKISSPEAAKADLAMLIAWEMASLLSHVETLKTDNGVRNASEVKNVMEQLKGVRELGKQLIEADNANQDYINFDGAKFKKVMDHWFETAKESLREIGFDDNTVKNFIMHWAEILGKTDQKLRREVQDIK